MREIKIRDYNLQYFGDLVNRPRTDMIVIHHTGNPIDDDCSAEQIHQSHLAQGWSGIGYHYVIRKDGTIEQGRPHWVVGAHAYGDNNHTIGIHVCGNFEIAEPTTAQVESTSLLLAKLCLDYGLLPDQTHIVGHSDLMATACPGRKLYDILQILRGKAIWYQRN